MGAACLGLWLAPGAARAQVQAAPSAEPSSGEDAAEQGARRHFERALELYRRGEYAQARDELSAAAKLDPNGKDLFFNLALVEEKLGRLEQAIAALQRFRELETDPDERERAAVTIERLRGAERHRAPPAAAEPRPCPAPAPAARAPSPVLMGAASLAAVSAVVGVIFGVKALSNDVGGEGTSSGVSVEQLRERARRAEREALVADVAFAISAASAATFVGVWLLAPEAPDTRGAGVTLQGYF